MRMHQNRKLLIQREETGNFTVVCGTWVKVQNSTDFPVRLVTVARDTCNLFISESPKGVGSNESGRNCSKLCSDLNFYIFVSGKWREEFTHNVFMWSQIIAT